MSLTDKDEELLEEMDSFISFSDKIIVVQILFVMPHLLD